MGGSAILDAAGKLREAIREAAARRFDCELKSVVVAEGMAVAPDSRMLTFAEIAVDKITADGSYASDKRTSEGTRAHVAVDPRTGHVQVLEYISVEDVGRIINPVTVHAQTVARSCKGSAGLCWSTLDMTTTASF